MITTRPTDMEWSNDLALFGCKETTSCAHLALTRFEKQLLLYFLTTETYWRAC